MSRVSVEAVEPVFTDEMNTRPTVAVVVVGVEAAGMKRTLRTYDPFEPAVYARKMSVPTVPPPCEDVFAAVTSTLLMLGVRP